MKRKFKQLWKLEPEFLLISENRWKQLCVWVGSLTGAVSSQRVTEEHEGVLSMVGNHAMSVMASNYPPYTVPNPDNGPKVAKFLVG